jgi:hypothetical protein
MTDGRIRQVSTACDEAETARCQQHASDSTNRIHRDGAMGSPAL